MNVFGIIIAALPVVFVCLPMLCHTFYLSSGDAPKFPMRIQLGSSCTSANEWMWIAIVSIATLMPHIKVAKRIFAQLSEKATRHSTDQKTLFATDELYLVGHIDIQPIFLGRRNHNNLHVGGMD